MGIQRALWVAALLAGSALAPALAGEGGDELGLPPAMSSDEMSAATGEGDSSDVAVGKDGDMLHSSASTSASIDGKNTLIGDVNTGSIGSLSDLMASEGVNTTQLSTGIGNIQQGVSAVAISN
ncbi:MAG: hypothetical protein ACREE7_12220 [Dongiaceae bacterium]